MTDSPPTHPFEQPDGQGGWQPDGEGDWQPPREQRAPPSIFSLEGKPAPGLYFVAWILCLVAAALFLAGVLARNPVLLLGGLIVLGAGLSTAAGYQIVARSSRPGTAYRGPSPLILFGIVLALAESIGALLAVFGILDPTTTTGILPGLVVPMVVYFGIVTVFVVRSGALTWQQMGWPSWAGARPGRLLGDAAAAVALVVPAALVMTIVGGLLAVALGVEPPPRLPLPRTSSDWAALVVGAVLVAPLGEELFFRGFALSAWQRDLGPRAALVRSSVLFAEVHLIPITASTGREGVSLVAVELVRYLPIAFLLGWLFQRRSIIASIFGHAAINATAVLLYALASRVVSQV